MFTRSMIGTWAKPAADWCGAVLVCALMAGCTYVTVPFSGPSSLSVGEWSGITSQGMPLAFTVAADETVTAIVIGYDLGDCVGTRTFIDLKVPTAPNVVCMPGPCRGSLESYRAFGYADGSAAGGPYTQINGLFLPRNKAQGQAVFSGYPECGPATVEWTATRR